MKTILQTKSMLKHENKKKKTKSEVQQLNKNPNCRLEHKNISLRKFVFILKVTFGLQNLALRAALF